jgi:hypothetical protein
VPILAYLAATIVALWGITHAMPTCRVIAGSTPISTDNRRVLTQEWLAEALTMWGSAFLIVVVTAHSGDPTARAWVYRGIAGLLLAMAALTNVTGSRTSFVWFKVCPVVLAVSAALLLTASAV